MALETPPIELRHTRAGQAGAESSASVSASASASASVGEATASDIRIIEDGSQHEEETPRPTRHEFSSLPPVDGGKDAWLFLAACFMVEALVWGVYLTNLTVSPLFLLGVCQQNKKKRKKKGKGLTITYIGFPFSFGLFQNYYSTNPPFAGSSSIAVIGTCAMGIMYLDGPLIMSLLRRFPRQGRWSPILGLLIMCTALAASSFATSVTHLIITQGILYAIGGSIAYLPCIVYLDEWFVRRKGLAYGIMWSGTGLAGVVLPLLLEHLLSTYGFQTTLRLWACLLFVLTAPLAVFIKPRLPSTTATGGGGGGSQTRLGGLGGLHFVVSRPFLLYQLANIVEAAGFFLPGIYLPMYARAQLNAGAIPAALTLLLLNVASVFGCVVMGSLIDRLHVTTCILISTIGTTVGTFLLWGLSTTLPVLYLFCIVYGLFAGSFTSAWPGIMREMARLGRSGGEDGGGGGSVDPTMVFAFLALGRGVGNLVSGPLSEALVRGLPWDGGSGGSRAFGGYGSGYGGLIAFTGATAFLGGGSWIWRRLGWL
ncbi:major facilitator superfamily domain-containing protein [Cercophora scortea]|uniref:Major facilitator superfamily domain-containing protein n=1 Tax=Cercophora scortea TaxID=314031 RepID=A0AAE0IZ76_9PEZI|nr:major facilitator superfamily domain-containing protein [Cercophora scortea]